MTTRSLRNRINENTNIWPGFVDVLATLLIVIIFVLMIFTVSQIYLSDAISGRDRVLKDLKNQINELSKILILESQEKQQALTSLSQTKKELGETKKELQSEELMSEQLQVEISKKRSEIFIKEQNLIALSEQIKELLNELRIVATALETYEGDKFGILETEGLGERINKALANRINQLKTLNKKLDLTNQKLLSSEANLANKVSELDVLNNKLSIRDKELQDQIIRYQNLTQDLIKINESLGLKDANVKEQLNAIQFKNQELLKLNEDLIAKDNTIFNLREKILELNNILSTIK